MSIKVRLLGFWRRNNQILFLLAWALALAFWLHTYTVEIGSTPIFFAAYATAGVILTGSLWVFVKATFEISPADTFEVWSNHHPESFKALQQEYEAGEFQVLNPEIERILKGKSGRSSL